MKTFRRILAIAGTEFRFGFRRGAPVVTTILIGLVFGAGILLGPLANLPLAQEELERLLHDPARIEQLAEKGLTLDNYRRISAEGMAEISVVSIPMAWPILLITAFLLLPAAAATSLPADRKFGPAELLHSLPIDGGIYVAGKAFGLVLTVIAAGLIPLALFLAVFEAALWNYLQVNLPAEVIWFFFKFALLDVLPLLAWAVMAGLLAGAPFRTRRAAIFPGLLAGILSLFGWLAVFKAPRLPFAQLDLNAYYLIQNYHSVALEALARSARLEPFPLLGSDAPLLGLDRVITMNLLLLAGLFLLGIAVRLWLKWKENF